MNTVGVAFIGEYARSPLSAQMRDMQAPGSWASDHDRHGLQRILGSAALATSGETER